MGEALGLRARKKRATRDTLHAAAVALAERRGLASVTIEAITEHAGVAPRTFFNYFASKEDAVINFDPDRLAVLRAGLEARPPGEPAVAALRRVLADEAELDADDLLRVVRLGRADSRIRAAQAARWQETEQVLIDAVAHRCGLDATHDLYPSLVVAAVVGAIRAAVRLWADHPEGESLTVLIGDAVDALAGGLPEPA